MAKLQKTADKSLSQPWCNHSNTIYNVQLQKTIVLRTQPRQQATLTQSLHCDLQPQMQQAHRSTHTWATTRCRTPRENRFDDETSAAEPAAHTRYLASPAETTLITRKNTRFRAPASSANQSPCNIHAAITTRFHGNKTWHQSCSHYTAICNQRFNKRIEQSSSFVITILRHHPSSSLPSVTTLGSLLLCGILLCDILLCDVLSPLHHPSSDLLLRDCLCYVM